MFNPCFFRRGYLFSIKLEENMIKKIKLIRLEKVNDLLIPPEALSNQNEKRKTKETLKALNYIGG